jgi:hypothetical protein
MGKSRSPAADLLQRYEQLPEAEQHEFDRLYLVNCEIDFARLTSEDLIGILRHVHVEQVERFLAWAIQQTVPEMAHVITEAMAAPQPGRPAKKERNAAILRLRDDGLTPGEIRLRLPELGFAKDTVNAIKMVIRHASSPQKGNGDE